MRAARWIQLLWTGIAALLFNPLTVSPGLERNPYIYVAYIWLYFAISLCCFFRSWRVAWWMALMLPLGLIVYMSEFTFGNLWLMLTWAKPYRENPWIIIPVFVIFCLTMVPGLCIYFFLYRDRERLVKVLQGT